MAFINTALVGAILMGFWIVSKTLWTPLIFHFTWNFLYYNIILLKKEAFADNSLLKFLFGYKYGLEEGFLTTLFLLGFGLLFLKQTKASPYLEAVWFKRKYEESALINGQK